VSPKFEEWVVAEMGPLSSLVVISYRIPVVTFCKAYLTVFAVLRIVMDRLTDGRAELD